MSDSAEYFKDCIPERAEAQWEATKAFMQSTKQEFSIKDTLMPLAATSLELAAVYFGTKYIASRVESQQTTSVYVAGAAGAALAAAITLGFIPLTPSAPSEPDTALSRPVDPERNTGDAPRHSSRLDPSEGAARPRPTTMLCSTMAELFREACEKGGGSPAYGTRRIEGVDAVRKGAKWIQRATLGDFEWITFRDAFSRACAIGAGLRHLGLLPGSRVAINANTSAEWTLCAHGCFQEGFTVATAYASLGVGALAVALNETEAEAVVVDRSLLSNIAAVKRGVKFEGETIGLPRLRIVVVLEDVWSRAEGPHAESEEAWRALVDAGVRVIRIDDLVRNGSGEGGVEGAGEATAGVATPPSPDDVAVIMYTSGSTGRPKGVMATHGNLIAGVAGIDGHLVEVGPEDVYLAYLPAAHILELIAEAVMLSTGTPVGFGSPLTIVDSGPGLAKGCIGDANALRPTVLAGVPAVFNKLKKAIEAKVTASPISALLFRIAYAWKSAAIEREGMLAAKSSVWDPLLFDKVRRLVLGGRVRQMVVGGGPISPETQRFIQVVFCCGLGVAYGLTECCGVCNMGFMGDHRLSLAGPPAPATLVRLQSTAEYDATASPPRGEVWLSGYNVFKGYYKRPDIDKEVFVVDDEGRRWFRTGDIGEWSRDGCLRIIDRIKDLVKLEGGEYVSLGKVEREIHALPLVDNACVYANSLRPSTVAIVVPNAPAIASALKIDKPIEELAKDPKVRSAILAEIKSRCEESGLKRFETPQAVVLADTLWTPDNFLTAAQKLRRRAIYDHYKGACEATFSE